jgi:hypothetical protein
MISNEIINILILAETNLEFRMANTIDITDKAAIILEYVSRVYNGKPFEPSFTVKIDNEYLKKDEDFTASITNNTNVGTATVTITGDGDYKGTAKATFRINPKPAKLKNVKPAKKSMKVTWYKQAAQTDGYQIMYSLKKNFKKGKKYTVQVRAYRTVNGKNYFGAWSDAKKVKIKKKKAK